MAVTTAQENEVLGIAARIAREQNADVTWIKAEIRAAIQALEDYVEVTQQNTTVRQGAGLAIEGAAPGAFNATAKTWLFFIFMSRKAVWEGVDI